MSKILLVEDNEMNRDMLSRRLLRKGYELVFAVDGEEAVSQAKEQNPDLILMDVSLPGMDGLEATRLIRQDEQTLSIPVIALTAHAMDSDRERCLAAGCNDYQTKPIDFPQLLKAISGLIGDHG
ncbi:response regulator [Synechococcus sp. BS55D]|uniref:response regulator n=1 Tax=Synechococcus sp. BS55D TaxID=2055943 RepID=UPI00103C6CBC|nr:response regulator [Synechococcus sp. BS55D]TCD57797.1 two-component system response regulator [Synechococcus sp. BS55D]